MSECAVFFGDHGIITVIRHCVEEGCLPWIHNLNILAFAMTITNTVIICFVLYLFRVLPPLFEGSSRWKALMSVGLDSLVCWHLMWYEKTNRGNCAIVLEWGMVYLISYIDTRTKWARFCICPRQQCMLSKRCCLGHFQVTFHELDSNVCCANVGPIYMAAWCIVKWLFMNDPYCILVGFLYRCLCTGEVELFWWIRATSKATTAQQNTPPAETVYFFLVMQCLRIYNREPPQPNDDPDKCV